MDELEDPPRPTRRWWRFSLRSLMILVLVLSAWLAGRYAQQPFDPSALVGTWQAQLPLGAQRLVTLKHLENDRFLLSSGGSVFNGIYRWQNGQLVVVEPNDQRMLGLVWAWKGDQMVLVAEPKSRPTGASYVGTTLQRPSP